MKIILFGSTGMLGRYLYMVLKDDYEIHCISRDKYDIENNSWEKLEDILNKSLQKNDIIINCAGIIPQKYNHDNFKAYIRINTLFPHKLKCIFVIIDDCRRHVGLQSTFYNYNIRTKLTKTYY